MFAFSNMFYVQLGPVMEGFNDQLASFISLARALFGDFDIDDIMNNSSGYLNAILFLVYLFVAVFILLSMFLAILGESQAAVRGVQDQEKASGEAPPEYGIFYYAGQGWQWGQTKLRAALTKKSPAVRGEKEAQPPAAPRPPLALQLEEMIAQAAEVRVLTRGLAEQVHAAKARPAAGAADAGALYALVSRVEGGLMDRFVALEERMAKEKRRKPKPEQPPAAAAATPVADSCSPAKPAHEALPRPAAEGKLQNSGSAAAGGAACPACPPPLAAVGKAAPLRSAQPHLCVRRHRRATRTVLDGCDAAPATAPPAADSSGAALARMLDDTSC